MPNFLILGYSSDANTMRVFSGRYLFHPRLSLVTSIFKGVGLASVDYAEASFHNCNRFHSFIARKIHVGPHLQHLSTNTPSGISWEGYPCAPLLRKLDIALKDDCAHESWEAFSNFRRIHGFPDQHLVNRVIILMSYSSNPHWRHKAYDLVLAILKEKPGLLHYDSLTRLALTFVRSQMPIPASTILRIMLEKGKFPPTDIWSTLLSHLVKTQIGSYLASDILIETCEFFVGRYSNTKNYKPTKLPKPSTTIFNLVLDSCLRFGSILKAQQIIELMPQAGVVADANSLILIARVLEMTGQRDDLKKLKACIDGISSVILCRHYRQFYDSLLSLHFKYNDIDAAAELVLDLYRRPMPLQFSSVLFTNNNGLRKLCLVHIGSNNLKNGYKIMAEPEHLQNDFVVDAQSHSGLVHFMDGRLVPSNMALAKLINGYVKERKLAKLSNLLISIEKMGSEGHSLSPDVIDACVQLGWLESAHDILDDLEAAAIPIGANTYTSLLRAYCKENKLEESKVLLKQMRKAGLLVDMSDENSLSSCLLEDPTASPLDKSTAGSVGRSCLAVFLDREIREENSPFQLLYEFNTSILFFCKAKMIEDALKTFKRMKQRNVRPTAQTFSHLVNGYSSLKMYREITILWGELRRRLEEGVLAADRDLFESLLSNFLKGGYFEKVMEIINYMLKHNMYTDKWKYRKEFLKLHKDLYKNLKASDARTDAQSKRLEHVRAFRRWVGIHLKT